MSGIRNGACAGSGTRGDLVINREECLASVCSDRPSWILIPVDPVTPSNVYRWSGSAIVRNPWTAIALGHLQDVR